MKKTIIINWLTAMLNDLQTLFFPPICLGCRGPVAGESTLLCTFCQANMPFTNYHMKQENKMEMRFWGRIKIVQASAFLHFQKGSSVQNLLHFLKYEHREDIGNYLGNWYGRVLKQSGIYDKVDFVIPVPIHQNRLKKRGYNQITKFSQCIAQQIQKEYRSDLLIRIKNSRTQINRNREERFTHLENAFLWKNKEELKGKHLLIIDDIMTTGATFEACCHSIHHLEGLEISICTLAIAE
ncbi:MAG: ComF family protein [Bacteroidetes bacterium]|nr:ComF family protein [Bacteroidota bacterium]